MTGGRQADNIESAAEELNTEGLNLEPPIYTNPAALTLMLVRAAVAFISSNHIMNEMKSLSKERKMFSIKTQSWWKI